MPTTTPITAMVPRTFASYADFVLHSSFYAASRVADLAMTANPLACGEEVLAKRGVFFPLTVFG